MANNVVTAALPSYLGQTNGLQPVLCPVGDVQPGTTVLTLTNVPLQFRVVSAWITECTAPNPVPKIGSAVFSTTSVQFDFHSATIRIVLASSWTAPLPAAAMLILG